MAADSYPADRTDPATATIGQAPFGEILLIFLRLGCTCFGGPIAHLGYFRAEFVERRQWLSERAYVDLVALSQFLPGPDAPSSSWKFFEAPARLAPALRCWRSSGRGDG